MRTGTRVVIHVKVHRFCPILTATRSVQQILVKHPHAIYNFKNPFRRFPVFIMNASNDECGEGNL